MKAMRQWLWKVFIVWRRQFKLIFTDPGVLLFFFGLPTLYPIVYTLVYNPEIAREMPVVVVDKCGTAESRELTRMFGRTESIDVIGQAVDLAEAREAMNSHACIGVLEIPADFSQRLAHGEQAVVPFYCDMPLLLRYRQLMFDLSNLQIAYAAQVQARDFSSMGLAGSTMAAELPAVGSQEVILGDPTQGFASFCMPCILVLIIQQSIVLGMGMLAGGAAERRRRNNGYDPELHDVSSPVSILGRSLAVLVIYVPLVAYTLYFVPWMFRLPQYGDFWNAIMLMLPLVLASTMLGQLLGVFVTERESSMVVFVFTSVVFLFLSGLTWPQYSMDNFWTVISYMVPSTWGVEGFVHINSNAAALWEEKTPLLMLWGLCALYYTLTCLLDNRYHRMNRLSAPAGK